MKKEISKEFVYIDGDGLRVYDYCESCEKPIHQAMIDGQGVCEHCKSPNQITIYRAMEEVFV